MTTGETEETCGGQKKTGGRTGGGGERSMKLSLSFTTLSTIAIQAGQSQIVISVLKSGSVVHLQLVQVHPGLCEIGSNQEENQTLIREQQQLMEKLKKHEREVLAVVEKNRQTEQRKRRDEGVMKQKRNKKQEEEEELYKAMLASLKEGWLLLLRLLERRQEVLTLASDFYCRAAEFAVSIDRVEDLQIRPDNDRLTEVQLTYDSMRRDLLGKSLQVLTSSSVLLQKLRQLQRTEALQRRGGVLQDEEAVEEESSQCSRGMALRLEELVETLQDRRRRADQAVRLQLQQVENDIMIHEEEEESKQAEDWSVIVDEVQDQNLESGSATAESTDLKSDSRTKETKVLQPGSRPDIQPEDLKSLFKSDETRSEETRNLKSRFTLNLKAGSRSDLKTDSKSEETRDLPSGSRLDQTPRSRSEVHPGSRLDLKSPFKSDETKNLQSGSTSAESTDLKPNLRTKETRDLQLGSRPEETRNLQSGFKLNLTSRSDFKIASPSEDTRDLEPGSRSLDQTPTDVQPGFGLDVRTDQEKTKDVVPGSRSDVHPGSRLDLKSPFKSEETRNQQSRSRSDVKCESRPELKPGSRPEETINLQSRFKLNLKSRSDLKLTSTSEDIRDLPPGYRLDQMPGSRSDVHPGFSLEEKPESRSEHTTDLDPGSKSQETRNLESGSTSAQSTDLRPDSRTKQARDLQPGSKPEESINLESGFKLNLKAGSRSDLKSDSKSEETRDLQAGSISDIRPGSRLDLKSPFKSDETKNQQSGSISVESTDLKPDSRTKETRDLQPGSRQEETRNLQSGFKLNLKAGSRSDLKTESKSEESRDLQHGSRLDQTLGSRSDVQAESRLDLESPFKSNETLNQESGSRSDVKHESRPELKPGSRSEQTTDLCPESRSQETINLHLKPRSKESLHLYSGSRSEKTTDLQPESKSDVQPETGKDLRRGSRSEAEDLSVSKSNRKQEVTKQHSAATTSTSSGQLARQESMLGNETQSGEDHAHQALLANKRQQLLLSCECLMDKICSWVQQGSSVLSNSSEAGRRLFEAEDTLNTHLQLHTQAESAGQDAENLKQILDQIRALHTDSTSRTSPQPPSEASRQLSPLKALTEQLKRGSTGRQTRTSLAQPSPPDPTCSLSPELAGQVDLVLKELQTLKRKIDSNLQLLQPYVTFLRMVQQVEEEVEELREIYIRSCEEEEEEEEKQEEKEAGSGNIRTGSPVKKKQDDASWQETLQRLLTAQELGNNCLHTVPMVSGAVLNLQSMVSVVQQTMEGLSRTKQEVNELQSQQQIQIQQQQEDCRKYHERLLKTLQDLNCVSELLDSCTLMDLGSDLQTSRLLERFSQARPHFNQLDAEVEYIEKSWETLTGVQSKLDVKELKGKAVKKEALSNVLKLQKSVKNKIQQSESILDLTSRFHLTSQQLEALLQSDLASPVAGSTGLSGSSEAELSQHREEQQQVQSLLKTASTLKTDICAAIDHSGWTCFRVEQLEARLLSLDSLCVLWLNEAARREEKLQRELLTCRLNDDINQLRDSFKELKKRFSNLKFNYLKRNDRTRNMKAVRNQLQQVELYKEKLQALRKRLQGVTARLVSEVKDGGVAREAEDAINELQRQMGDFERSVSDHQKTLEMTRRLQQAMEEYQFWCEEASATIARVGKFSSECRSTEAVAVLYQQFEKFVWPTVPEQEERISQISELAVRLHGVEEGRRYIEKTVSKHSEMVESIRELSDGLMELEAKLKLEGLKKQQNNAEKEIKEVGETERRRENDAEEKDEEKEKLKENRKKEQTDNRSTQEANDMYELKETGHTPELTAEHDGKEVPVKRQNAANRKPPLQKSRSQEADPNSHRQQLNNERRTSSYCSTHTFSLSCSPVETRRRIHTIHSQLQPQATPPPSMIGPLFSDIQREFQRKEAQEMGQRGVYASCESNMTPPQYASAGGLSEAELQQQEAMTEDSLSNDEYECVSPDDISLPPLAETPESNMIQSDVEEGFCFSSHSTHINQYSHHSGSSTGAVQQQRESSQTESCPTPPTSLHSNTRLRSESSSFVQSPLTVPPPTLITRTLCSILRTCETTTENVSQSADLSLDSPELNFPHGSNPVQKNITSDSCSNKENNVPEKRGPSQTDLLLKKCDSQNNQPHSRTGTQGMITQNVASKGETLPQTDPIAQAAEHDQPFQGPDLHKDKTPSQNTSFLKCSYTIPQTAICFPQFFPDSESDLHQDINSFQTREETTPVSKPQRNSLTNPSTSTITQQTVNIQSSHSDSPHTLPQSSSSLSSPQEGPLSQIDPVPHARGFTQSPIITGSALHKDMTKDTGFTTMPQDNLPQAYPDSRSTFDQEVPSSQTSKSSSSLNTATTVTQKHIYCQSPPPDSHCNVPQNSSNLGSQQGSSSPQGNGDLPEHHDPIPPEPNTLNNISIFSSTITSSNRFSSKQSHQTVYSLHESLTSTCTQQCVHDPGMTPSSPAKPTASPQPESQTQALAQQANLHVLSSPPHLLTPDQDPNICQPMAIREEIRLTPQIKGPPLPAPPTLAQAQSESVPQGKASKPGPPSFTRPLSRATLMEGSPVTLEVEVTGHPEPTLSWFQDGEASATGLGQSLACEDRKHFLFIPEASDSDGGLPEARAANHHDVQHEAANSCSSGDKWLVAEVFDIITLDWQSWFGTLCVLLWLLYLILL